MKIVVLAGGLSTERDVSITSGILVAKALRETGHKVVLLDVFMGYEEPYCNIEELFETGYDFTKELGVRESIPDLEQIKNTRKNKSDCYLGDHVADICKNADITFLALHGDIGENGKLQATFDVLGIKYTGSGYLGSAVAMNKGLSKNVFAANGISTPAGAVYQKADQETGAVSNWNTFPCVVKPCSGGSSVGVYIANNREEFLQALEKAFVYETEVIVEQYIKGREFSVGILGDVALPIIEIIPENGFYDYVNKYQSGKTTEICPAQLDEPIARHMCEQALKAFAALKLEAYARVDFLADGTGDIYCLEANTLPGMTPISLLPQEAAEIGLSYGDLCNRIIQLSLEKYK